MSEEKKDELTLKEKITTYLKGVKAEWGKITWPEKRQVVVETVVVLFVVFFFTFMVFIFDKLFDFMFKLIPGG
ncbi:MAG: preprotein translocase subunit SecE [Candidatus Gastranaerophilales bacterium]|nr:preprotein translocase subunit SecE [Candidatus Gastranaerophilales bacterium]